MRKISSFLFGVVVGGALVFCGQRYHVVRTTSGFEFVPKLTSGFAETYVDVRNFQASDWEKHKTLAAAIVQAKKENILLNSSGEQVGQGMNSLMTELKRLRDG